jgi:gluconolactonase
MNNKIVSLFYWLMPVSLFSQITPGDMPQAVPGAKVIQAETGFMFTEGCSVDPDGRVFFTDQPNDRIYIWDEGTGVTIFKTGCERSNGTFFDREGNLLACADRYNKLVKFTLTGDMLDVYTGGFDGKHFNGPNDLWSDSKGGIYFTDPYYHRDYWEPGHSKVIDVQGVYYLKPAGEIVQVINDLEQPNGIVGTPDGKILYVADIGAGITWKYVIESDGTLSSKTKFASSGSDGMTVDSQGNVYLTFGKVLVYNEKGQKIGEIKLPENPSNVCFGGKDRKTLFITAGMSVYTLGMKVKGVE